MPPEMTEIPDLNSEEVIITEIIFNNNKNNNSMNIFF